MELHRGTVAKEIVERFYPSGVERPKGLLTAIFIALGEAEGKGFESCLAIFEDRTSLDIANDDIDAALGSNPPPKPHPSTST